MRSRDEKLDRYAPLLADLAPFGIELQDIDLLYEVPIEHPETVPVFIEHLSRRYPHDVLFWIGTCLQERVIRPWWDDLKALYLTSRNETVRDRAAAALSSVAVRQHYEDLLAFVENKKLGESRVYFLRKINRIGNRRSPGAGRAVIERLVADPDLTAEATAILRGKGVNE